MTRPLVYMEQPLKVVKDHAHKGKNRLRLNYFPRLRGSLNSLRHYINRASLQEDLGWLVALWDYSGMW